MLFSVFFQTFLPIVCCCTSREVLFSFQKEALHSRQVAGVPVDKHSCAGGAVTPWPPPAVRPLLFACCSFCLKYLSCSASFNSNPMSGANTVLERLDCLHRYTFLNLFDCGLQKHISHHNPGICTDTHTREEKYFLLQNFCKDIGCQLINALCFLFSPLYHYHHLLNILIYLP